MIFNLLGTPADGDVDMLEREDAKKYMRCFAAGATTNDVEHEEALEAGAVVRQLANAVEDQVDDLLADGVVAAGVVVGRILLAGDQLLWVVQLAVGAGADLIDDGRLEVDEHAARDVLARAGLREERVQGSTAPSTRYRPGCRTGPCG